MRTHQVAILILVVIFDGCRSNQTKSKTTQGTTSDNENPSFELSIFEVLRHRDTTFIQILDKISEIEGFRKITELDYQNYQDNLLGVTGDSKYKSTIIEQVRHVLNAYSGIIPVWSKYRIQNTRTGEEFFYLYLLLNNQQTIKISTSEIISSEINRFSDSPQLLLEVNADTAHKWSRLTERAYLNDQGYLAFVIDEEVYSCPYIAAPISGAFMSVEFENMDEAHSILNKIKKSR